MPNYEQINTPGDRTPIEKFSIPGQEAEGVFRGLRPGKFRNADGSPNLLIQIGERVFGSSTVLDDRFSKIAVGTQVKVIYLGFSPPSPTETGRKPYKMFNIGVVREPQQAPAVSEGPAPQERASSFDQLLSRIQDQKGETIAQALKAAVLSMTTTPEGALEELRSVAAQVGVTDAEVPF